MFTYTEKLLIRRPIPEHIWCSNSTCKKNGKIWIVITAPKLEEFECMHFCADHMPEPKDVFREVDYDSVVVLWGWRPKHGDKCPLPVREISLVPAHEISLDDVRESASQEIVRRCGQPTDHLIIYVSEDVVSSRIGQVCSCHSKPLPHGAVHRYGESGVLPDEY